MAIVTVIIPTYKSAGKLKISLDSLVDQSYKNFEVVIVDANSKDKIKDICDQYKYKINITLINNPEDKGPADARAVGIKNCNSKYICFLDALDFWHKNKLKNQIDEMETKNLPFTYTNTRVVDLTKNKISQMRYCKNEYSYEDYLKSRGIVTSSVCILRSLLDESIINVNIRIGGEETIWWQLLMKKHSIEAKLIDTTACTYYVSSGDSLSSDFVTTFKQQWHNLHFYFGLSGLKRIITFSQYLVNALYIKISLRLKPWETYK
tara:strand:+ start:349 stop:1137 length:789 start_codon:yes stop_codon:yes gene_type:complete